MCFVLHHPNHTCREEQPISGTFYSQEVFCMNSNYKSDFASPVQDERMQESDGLSVDEYLA